jgi:pSer/pThr/pTyr-binding forkhead associated (FHA) protein
MVFGNGEVVVRDLDSTNGTWVNGERVTEGILRSGDELGIAHLRFRLIFCDPTEGLGSEKTLAGGYVADPR